MLKLRGLIAGIGLVALLSSSGNSQESIEPLQTLGEDSTEQEVVSPIRYRNKRYSDKLDTLILASPRFGFLVQGHVRKMFEQGYANSLSLDDLFHGHLLRKRSGGRWKYDSLKDVLSETIFILYHTDEKTIRWSSSPLPIEQKIPRSLVGYNDGRIIPACELINMQDTTLVDGKEIHNYIESGSIHCSPFLKKFPLDDIYSYPYPYYDTPHPHLAIEGGPYRIINGQFYIFPEDEGRFTANGQKFEVYFVITKRLDRKP